MFKLYITGDLGFEFWMDVPGYEGVYRASTYGNIWSNKKNRLLRQRLISAGYPSVCFGNKTLYVHRVIASTFLPNPFNKQCVDHKDTNRLNCRVENLHWVTHRENNLNPITNERQREASTGQKHPDRKGLHIFAYQNDGTFIGEFISAQKLADAVGLSRWTIRRHLKGLQKNDIGYIFSDEPIPSD